MRTRRLRAYEDVLHASQRVVDIVFIILAHAVACWAYDQPWHRSMGAGTIIAMVVFSMVAEVFGVYQLRDSEPILTEARPVLLAWLVTASLLVFFGFATKTSEQFSRVVTFGWIAGAAMALCGWRALLRLAIRVAWSTGRHLCTVAIAGATPSAEHLCQQMRERPWLGLKLIGIFDDRCASRRHAFADPCPHAGSSAELVEACRAGKVDVVYVALPLHAEARIGELLRALANTTATVYLVADFLRYDLLCARWTAIGSAPLISVHGTPFTGITGWLKRVEDLVAGLAIVCLVSIPLLVIAVMVKLSSPGPIFFRQRRYGLNGREIRVLKFRTMSVCEDGPKIEQAKRDDPRVTPLGKILRRASLDELPQFLQVLTGEMSIVGPRPHAVAHNEQFRSIIPGYMLRHKVKPGITGWAQVNGWRGETPGLPWMKKRVEHDLEYIENWSLLLDIKIILLTVVGRKKSRNAY